MKIADIRAENRDISTNCGNITAPTPVSIAEIAYTIMITFFISDYQIKGMSRYFTFFI